MKKKTIRRNDIALRFGIISMTVVVALFAGYTVLSSKKPCANSISCISNLSGTYEKQAEAVFMGKQLSVPLQVALSASTPSTVLGTTTATKTITVDLTKQRLYAYEGKKVVYSFPVSTGKWYKTPTGTFQVWIKVRYTRMSGGNPADGTYYNVPNVPHVLFFGNDEIARERGFSIHGAYWHNNFGHPMSHGCVNMRLEDAGIIYDWATPVTDGTTTYATTDNPGITVTIVGTPPEE